MGGAYFWAKFEAGGAYRAGAYKKKRVPKRRRKKTEILEKIPWRGFGSERQCTKG